VVAAMAAVSEAALIYIASHRNMWISLTMIALEAALSVALIVVMRKLDLPLMWQATGPAIALLLSLGFAAIAKSMLLSGLLHAPVSGWRWPLVWAAAAGVIAGEAAIQLPEWAELAFGIPIIMVVFGAVLWTRGFGPQDRELFRMSKAEIAELSLPDPSTGGDAPR